MGRRVFVVLVDKVNQRVGVNIKDCALPPKVSHFEGQISLLGGAIEEGETPFHAMKRELGEELQGLAFDTDKAVVCLENEHAVVYALPADLSGDRHNRGMIERLMQACREGEAAIRTYKFIREKGDDWYVTGIKPAILAAIEKIG